MKEVEIKCCKKCKSYNRIQNYIYQGICIVDNIGVSDRNGCPIFLNKSNICDICRYFRSQFGIDRPIKLDSGFNLQL